MINQLSLEIIFYFFLLFNSCNQSEVENKKTDANNSIMKNDSHSIATFGAGCFWCIETLFEKLNGVHSVVSGYAGGNVANPTYEEVCSGTTGHAEVCQITYDSTIIRYETLLKIFWEIHDPTTLNRQGNDVGTQYRSVIFYSDENQKSLAEYFKTELDKSGAFKNPIVTEISPLPLFYKAEDYHQNYYERNPNQGYCVFVIKPKIDKFEKVFKDKIKNQK